MRYVWMTALALLAAGSAPAQAQRAPKLKSFEVTLTRTVALPPLRPSVLGEKRSVGNGDVILSLPLAAEDIARPLGDITLTIEGRNWVMKANDQIPRAMRATGGDLATLGSDARIYCGESERTKVIFDIRPFGTFYQPCLVDSDGDDRFDKAFVSGAGADRRQMFDIAPVRYQRQQLRRLPGSRIDIVFFGSLRLRGPVIGINFYFGGVQEEMGGVVLAGMQGLPYEQDKGLVRLGMGATGQALKVKKLPLRFAAGDALFTVHAYDRATGRATISIDRDPVMFRVLPWQVSYR